MEQECSSVEKVKENARDVVREASPWAERFARFGYLCRGLIYIVIGVLAEQLAFGNGHAEPETDDALRAIVSQPLGLVLAALLGAGMVGYCLWRLVQAIFDPEKRCVGIGGIPQRIAFFIGSLAHAGIALTALQLIIGAEAGDQSRSTKDWTARLIAQPYGPWLVGLVGLIVIGAGLMQLYQALSKNLRDQVQLVALSKTKERWALVVSRLGLAARGIVFGIMGGLLVQAALHLDPEKAEGLGGALRALAHRPYGPWLLGLVAVGLIAYGIYNLVQARYRRIPSP